MSELQRRAKWGLGQDISGDAAEDLSGSLSGVGLQVLQASSADRFKSPGLVVADA